MTEDLAYLEFRDRFYFAQGRATSVDSPVTRLIEGIYLREPQHAREILRSRIFCTETPGAFALGMIKVAAKRWSRIETLGSDAIRETLTTAEGRGAAENCGNLRPDPHAGSIAAQGKLALGNARKFLRTHEESSQAGLDPSAPRYTRNRSVVAALLDPSGTILGVAKNTNALHRTRHAEMNVIQDFLSRTPGGSASLPAGFRLLVSLKPCRMCAGLIWECAQPHRDFRVWYRDFDPGPLARETLLDPSFEESLDQACNGPG